MRYSLILAVFAVIVSCQVHDGNLSYENHVSQIDSTVSGIVDTDSLKFLLSVYETVGDDAGMMVVMRELGRIHRESSDFGAAIKYHGKALSLARKLRDTVNVIHMLNQLGTDFRRIGALNEAAEKHYEALSCCGEYSDRTSREAIKRKVISLNGIGNVHLTLNNNEVAERIFREALSGEQALGSHLGQAINYANIGSVKESLGDMDSAWVYYGYSMEQNRLAGSRLGMSLCYNHFGRLSEREGDWVRALESYMKSYELMHGERDRWHWLESCLSMARVCLAMGQTGKAGRYLEEGLEAASEMNSWEHLADVYRLKAEYEAKTGNSESSVENYRRHLSYADSISRAKDIDRLNNARVNYITEKVNREKELINRAYVNEQKKKKTILYSLVVVVLVSFSAIASLIYALKTKARMQNVIRKASLARQEFFTNVTHEFRTPLTVILGCAEELKSRPMNEEIMSSIESISRQGQRLLTLVNQLLDIAKVRSSIGNADWRSGDVTAFIQMVVENIRPLAVKNMVELEYHSEEKSVDMDFVPDFMNKILTNLLCNALKYTPKGGSVMIGSKVEDKGIRISVSDTGCGISSEDLSHVFEPFYSTGSGSGSGTGIGLALAKQMTEAMGGSMEVSGMKGSGSTFTLTLPLKHGESGFEKWISSVVVPEGTVSSEGHCIRCVEDPCCKDDMVSKDSDIALVVEDNEDIARYIGNVIRDSYSVIYARDGREGLVKAEEYVPDVIITDIMMPECDGLEMTREIRKSELLNHIPVIIVTAKGDDAYRLQGLDSGADAYLVKPFSPDELRLRIRKLVEYRGMLRKKYSQILEDSDVQTVQDVPEQEMVFLAKLNNLISLNISLSDLNSEKLADGMCLSKSQLNRKVKSMTGINTSAYIKQAKLAYSQVLLKDSDKPIGEIVLMCGFESASYFTKLFREKFGMTPSEYRRENT